MQKMFFLVFMSLAIAFSKANEGCQVFTENNDCCVFPFKYKGKTYDSCSFVDSVIKPWCSLSSDYDKERKFGYCKFQTCEIKTSDRDCCVFPFKYNGVSYKACTMYLDQHPWCGTKSDVEFWTREPRGNCRSYVDPCFSNPCQNNGVCHSDKDQFHCTCLKDYKGHVCAENVLSCERKPCKNGGTCEDVDGGFKCHCLEGFKGIACQTKIVDPCKNSPCKNDAKCFSDLAKENYYCNCLQGYEGNTCEKRVYPCDSSPCQNNGTCKNDENSFHCTCPNQYEGDTCELRVDPCQSNPCKNEGECLSDLTKFAFSCSCASGYDGATCENRVYPCDSLPCENNGTCENNEDSFHCICPKQYEGDACELRVDPCKGAPCRNGGQCLSDMPKFTFTCNCPVGYEGLTCENKVYPCDSSPCENNGTCKNDKDSFHCDCPKEYEGDTCEERVDPCQSKPCKNEGKCLSDLPKFTFFCSCPVEYEGETCEKRVHPCDSSPCENNGTCYNNEGNFHCICPNQYEGETCELRVDPCKSSPCKNGGKCLSDLPKFNFSCSCAAGYEGETCEKRVKPCDSSPCQHGGTCVSDENSFQCECTHNYEGNNCEIKVDICQRDPCQNEGKCFSDISKDEFICSCPVEFEGKTCSKKVHPCDSSPCENGGTCENNKTSFVCNCPERYEGETCSNKADPCESSPCKNSGACQSKGVEFSCECGKGYAGLTCETQVDPCESSPCENGGICKQNSHDYICDCSKTGFNGPNCADKGFWKTVSKLTPPFHIAADGHGDLGARFVDLNGDGRMDLVFHRWINANNIQKGAYLNLPKKGYISAPEFTPPYHIAAEGYADVGARFVDLNGDGKIDMVFHRWIASNYVQKGAFINIGTGWLSAPQYTPPFHITAGKGNSDLGARFVELNGDGKIDFVYHRWLSKRKQQKGAYLNTGNGWEKAPDFTPPFHIAAKGHGDLGARFTDLNGDGKQDLVYHRWVNIFYQQKGAYLNNGKEWTWAPQYTPPFHIAVDGLRDTGLRLIDFNGDGKIDIVYYRWINHFIKQKGAYLNNGNGWTSTPSYTPPFHIAADKYGDLGARFADVNGDGLIDFVYHRCISSKNQQKGAYVNTGCGWRSEPQYIPLFHIAADGFKDLGARFVELNGDGATDLAYHRWITSKKIQKGAYLSCGDTNPAFCLIYAKYCSIWKMAYTMCRLTCNTCQF